MSELIGHHASYKDEPTDYPQTLCRTDFDRKSGSGTLVQEGIVNYC